jgi:integrase
MASIFKRKHKDGKSFTWRAVVRLKNYPVVCETFERKQEALDWGAEIERRIKLGQFKFDKHTCNHTYSDVVQRFINDGALEHHRSAEDTLRHLNYWKDRLGTYGLVHLTSELISKERQLLLDTPSNRGEKRKNSTINRYVSSLSSSLSYATGQLRWINENPCSNLKKLKENPGRDRVLSEVEIIRLLDSCRKSRSVYLFCIVLISLTIGARQGEILGLEWKDIDFDNKLAYLKQTKNGRPRSISLADPVIEELQKLYQTRDPHKSLVFASKTAFGRIDIKKAWKQTLKLSAISHCRAHDMRHTFATLAASQGASNLELATAMGHRTLEMLQRYTHLDVQITKKFSKHISDKIFQKPKESL